jgi:hypothetical protein
MAHRINERNIGNSTLEGMPKKRSKKFTSDESELILDILLRVYDAMEEDEFQNIWYNGKTYVDGGRFILSLTGEQMFDLREAIIKLNK